jgi:hypothetical protein
LLDGRNEVFKLPEGEVHHVQRLAA